jgi:nucleotide-binding universal stress UspA family protein
MLKRVLVPLDGSKSAEAILPHVYRLLKRVGGGVILLRSAAPGPEGEAAAEYLEGVEEKVARRGLRAGKLVLPLAADAAILEAAKGERADLIAMATHGHSRLSRLLFGSVTDAVLRTSPIPVLVARSFLTTIPGPLVPLADRPVRTILVPLGTGPDSLVALPPVAEVARITGAQVLLVRVLEGGLPSDRAPVPTAEAACRELTDAARFFLEPTVRMRVHCEQGAVAPTLLELCRSQDVDLVALATHGRSDWSRFLKGSITEALLRELEIPVLGIRAPDRKGEASPPGEESTGLNPAPLPLSPA